MSFGKTKWDVEEISRQQDVEYEIFCLKSTNLNQINSTFNSNSNYHTYQEPLHFNTQNLWHNDKPTGASFPAFIEDEEPSFQA